MVEKAYLETETGDTIKCLFNPSQLSMAKANSWEQCVKPGRSSPALIFGGGKPGSMSFELVCDSTSDGKPVTEHTLKMQALLEPTIDDGPEAKRPPWVIFHWAHIHSWKAIVESLDLSYTHFANNGDALRAKAKISLKQFDEGNFGPQNPTSGTPRPQVAHQVQIGETLDRIAAKHYGDSTQWRLIAAANGITDPLAIRPGSRLEIPRREAVARDR